MLGWQPNASSAWGLAVDLASLREDELPIAFRAAVYRDEVGRVKHADNAGYREQFLHFCRRIVKVFFRIRFSNSSR
ncbi:hypothetical protein D3C86_1978480 [compost metagenome]